jgi:hypothetical protein
MDIGNIEDSWEVEWAYGMTHGRVTRCTTDDVLDRWQGD